MVNLNIKKWAVFGLITASFTACDLDVIPPIYRQKVSGHRRKMHGTV